ncbi:hypothetical protein [Geoalkalibacter halelectricus]|uniref:hypothetical protein n=1 Tax=Geoalkalibacter halelectricus TaxID=2847045 RepID=UPI003D2506BC
MRIQIYACSFCDQQLTDVDLEMFEGQCPECEHPVSRRRAMTRKQDPLAQRAA